ncbi:Plasmodium variant antigen protein Cir/Yir/Bir, putative [Plasmodium chabaudi adami]|uniref:Plasmodium variant antigen protein Cir/Yir/Bir, putative n=1 Tax=Plasmodium chabaudi adami TaxID=5826 RepID=A0A1C6WMX1_PLACE|nr:Plasmodium variant antigen protein Cir/Yir/Bir, putative [Plasmodium chabaudi adami]
MIKEVCEGIKKVDDCLQKEIKSTGDSSDKILYIDYCPEKGEGGNRQCETNSEKISAGVLWLLSTFEHISDGNFSENEKGQLAEYAILLLSSKLYPILNEESTTLKNVYTKYIKDNEDNEKFKDHIDDKINSMTIDIKDISKFYEALKILCNVYNEDKEKNMDCTKCLQNSEEFLKIFKELDGDSNVTKDSFYNQIWSTLSTEYNNFKKYYAEKCSDCSNLPDLSSIKTSQNSMEGSGTSHVQDKGKSPAQGSESFSVQSTVLSPDATSSGSSVASKLIPALLVFAIPVFLGIAYKYSLFGIDKRLQRKDLREKPKKIKKKMNHYI